MITVVHIILFAFKLLQMQSWVFIFALKPRFKLKLVDIFTSLIFFKFIIQVT